MALGAMNEFITFLKKQRTTDADGFVAYDYVKKRRVRCAHEQRRGSVVWANLAAFSEATDIFRLRVIPNFEISREYIIDCGGQYFEILSVEDVKGRGMYLEILSKRTESAVR